MENDSSKLTAMGKRVFSYVQGYTETAIHKSKAFFQSQKFTSFLSTSKQFYSNHKEVVVGITVAVLTYSIVQLTQKNNRKENDQTEQQLGENEGKRNAQNPFRKTFIDDDQGEFDEPSTDIKRQQQMRGKPKKASAIFQSQSQEEENRQDKIFFQMFHKYQQSEQP